MEDASNYITAKELEAIAKFIEFLEAYARDDISVGAIPIYDVNGERLGYVRMTDGGTYALSQTPEDVYS